MTRGEPIGSRHYDAADQQAFAALSGDHNPLHVDAAAARRTMFGQPLVHGVHQLLWALDAHCASGGAAPATITARFLKPAFLDEELTLTRHSDGKTVALSVDAGMTQLTQVTLSGSAAAASPWQPAAPQRSTAAKPLTVVEIAHAHGSLPLDAATPDSAALFPAATARLGGMTIAALLALTRLVGMECPGLHSVFSSLSVTTGGSPSAQLDWRVTKASARLAIVNIDVDGGGLAGKLVCFVRPPPQEAPATAELARHAVPAAGRRALIIGGSRGLGLVTARLLAFGGADVALTWHRGQAEAEAATAAITAEGGRARAVQLDTADPASGLAALTSADFAVDELYYFATPRIFTRKKALFEPALFTGFADSYVSGLMRIVMGLRPEPGQPLRVFIPSTAALDEPLRDLFEYTVAKAAAEQVARLLPLFNPAISVISARLPRLPTDQTATLMATPAADPVVTMRDIIAAMAPAKA